MRRLRILCLTFVLLISAGVAENRLLLTSSMAGDTAGETPEIRALSEAEQQVINSIDEGTVTSTVSFLASDEMAGRNTPSPELAIASAYVAARFKGAGLEGPEGSSGFYQTTEIIQIAPPRTGLKIEVNGQPVSDCHVLMGLDTPAEVSGTVANANGAAEDQKFSGPVWLSDSPLPPQMARNPAGVLVGWYRRVNELAKRGATAVLVPIGAESQTHAAVQRIAENPVSIPSQITFTVPIVLVPAGTPLDGQPVQLSVPPNRVVAQPVHNVIGILKGSDPELSKQAIIISAHLDHIGTQAEGEDRINNGADDNATGVTAVLTLADAYSRLPQKPRRTVIFMTFWGEEKGLLGSKYYAEHPIWPLDQTVANINIEMIGRPEENAEGKAWGTGWTKSTLCDLVAAGAQRAGVTVFHREDVSEMLYARSDNYSFVNAGVIAHSFSAGSLHSDYHKPTDEVSRLNLPHMTKIIRGLMAGTLPLADGEVTPVKSETK